MDQAQKLAMVVAPEKGTDFFNPEILFDSLRNGEFSFDSGLAEIIDNSIEANASNIDIHINTELKKISGNKRSTRVISTISVTDNGVGMPDDILRCCLRLGETVRSNSIRHIGRFGVGLTLGGISFAKRIEVYSRTSADTPFHYTYIDLEEVEKGEQKNIPVPIQVTPPEQQAAVLNGSSGTIIVLSNCDRLQFDPINDRGIKADEQIIGLHTFLGRTYRKFLEAAVTINLHVDSECSKVYLHDPLYMMAPTFFDEKDVKELKAEERYYKRLSLPIPKATNGETADITIRMSLLPLEWRKERGQGRSEHASKRKIPDNEGVSILRADREVLYAKIPFLIGPRGQATYEEIDRWWGCEISFPPELDDYFQVRYIKRGAEPNNSLKDKIRVAITAKVNELREEIKRDYALEEEKKRQENGFYNSAEQKMTRANAVLPQNKTPKANEKELDRIVAELEDSSHSGTQITRENIKKELCEKPYIIKAVELSPQLLFEPKYLGEQILLKLNVKHPFYKKVLKPLCGPIEKLEDETNGSRNQQIWDAILLLLMTHCKAEAQFPEQLDFLSDFRAYWSITLGAVYNRLD